MSVTRPPTPAEAISPGGLLDIPNAFEGPSWDLWRVVLKAAWGEALTAEETALFREVAERDPPVKQVRELWCKIGRGGGKDLVASAIATVAALRAYATRRPGEKTLVACIAVDRQQAEIVFDYITAYFGQVPALNALVACDPRPRRVDEQLSAELGQKMYAVSTSDNTLDLTNGARIVVYTNSFRSVRGRSLICAILDEVAFYRSDESANPDKALYDALEPALARVPGSIMIGISSPYRRTGLLYEKWAQSYGKDDPDVLFVQGATRLFNPGFPQAVIDRRLRDDPEAAGAEYLALWRDDLSGFLDRELVEGAVDTGIVARPPRPGIEYRLFVDPSGGRGDSCAAAIAHADLDDQVAVDAVYERKSPFNPTEAAADIAALAREYGISRAVGDNYGAQWTVEAFSKVGLLYEKSERARSAIYLDALPLFTAGRLRLIDNTRLTYQFINLVRQTSKSGKDSVHKQDGGRDDLCNAVAGVVVLVASDGRAALIRPSDLLTPDQQAVEPHKYPEAFTGVAVARSAWRLWVDHLVVSLCGWPGTCAAGPD